MLREAARLKGEAEAAAAVLEAKRKLREAQEKVNTLEEPKEEEQAATLAAKLEEAQGKLRKAEAFALPEKASLAQEVKDLEQRLEALQLKQKQQQEPPQPPQPPQPRREAVKEAGLNRNGKSMAQWNDADWEDLAVAAEEMSVEQRFDLAQALGQDGRRRLSEITARKEKEREKVEKEAEEKKKDESRKVAQKLSSKLTFDKIKEMSNEERFQVAQEVGPAYIVSLGMVAACYWAINLPFLAFAYHEATGKWPGLDSLGSLGSLEAAGTFAGVFALYALLKPVRLFVALLVTPWTVENVMPNIPGFDPPKDEKK